MRTGALALLLFMASCGQGDRVNQANQAEAVPDAGRPQSGARAAPPVTITIAATGPSGCAASWDGQQVTPQQVTERARVLIDRAITAVGGIQNLTDETLPVLNVEAPADLGFACADTILFALQRTGMANVRLRPAGGRAPVLADFPVADLPEPVIPMVIGVGAGGQVTWNDEPIGPDVLAARLRRLGSDSGPGPGEMGLPPGAAPEFRPSREATFGQVYELLRTTRRYHLRPFLFVPSAEAGAAPPAAPPPPPPSR